MRTHALKSADCVGANDASSNYGNLGWGDAGYTAQKNAFSA
jgi:hypothetical protein